MAGSERLASIDPSASSTSEYEFNEEHEDDERIEEQDAELGMDPSESSEGSEAKDSKGGEGRGSVGGEGRRVVDGNGAVALGGVGVRVDLGGDESVYAMEETELVLGKEGNDTCDSNGENESSPNSGNDSCLRARSNNTRASTWGACFNSD